MKVCKSGFDHFSALSGTLSPNFIKSPFLGENFPLFLKIVHGGWEQLCILLYDADSKSIHVSQWQNALGQS